MMVRGKGEAATKTSQEAFDRAVRARTRHMWVAVLGVLAGPVIYCLAQAMSFEWGFMLGGAFVGFASWAFRRERALQRDIEKALHERHEGERDIEASHRR